ncbi:hypothetical protein PoB_005160000 [Plakobranchus ocellatus]|uniref:Secreted protein n=1 Tax=Plakobranchus ocellatus TaxID=259542 RepID=A0AAV4C141_9GAST|nr:hypothetical protein PoB_005160000 [Plakobranchus ocellatus]
MIFKYLGAVIITGWMCEHYVGNLSTPGIFCKLRCGCLKRRSVIPQWYYVQQGVADNGCALALGKTIKMKTTAAAAAAEATATTVTNTKTNKKIMWVHKCLHVRFGE